VNSVPTLEVDWSRGSTRAIEADQPYQAYYDAPYIGREGYSVGGEQDFTVFYMGGIHPRPKQTVGRRLALAVWCSFFAVKVCSSPALLRFMMLLGLLEPGLTSLHQVCVLQYRGC
jgi:hypothetical protein